MIEPDLTRMIADCLPGGRIEVTPLPQCPAISLYLLNQDYPEAALTAEQARRLMETPMFWIFCWASGQAMARYLLDHPHMIKDKRVLDFGCGSGIAAIAAAKAGAKKVWACDIDEQALSATRQNCRLNSVCVDIVNGWDGFTQDIDIILAADVLYDPANLVWLERFTRRAPEVLVADSRVKKFNAPFYKKTFEAKSFTIPDLAEPSEFGRVSFYYARN